MRIGPGRPARRAPWLVGLAKSLAWNFPVGAITGVFRVHGQQPTETVWGPGGRDGGVLGAGLAAPARANHHRQHRRITLGDRARVALSAQVAADLARLSGASACPFCAPPTGTSGLLPSPADARSGISGSDSRVDKKVLGCVSRQSRSP
jgi:hypothetical protein